MLAKTTLMTSTMAMSGAKLEVDEGCELVAINLSSGLYTGRAKSALP